MKQHEMIMGVSYTIAFIAVAAFAICTIAAVCLMIRDGIKKILKIESPSGSAKKEGLFQKYKSHKPYRKQYILKPKIEFRIDKDDYLFMLLPTIMFVPWFSRFPNSYAFEIMWLNINIGIGLWGDNPNHKEDIY